MKRLKGLKGLADTAVAKVVAVASAVAMMATVGATGTAFAVNGMNGTADASSQNASTTQLVPAADTAKAAAGSAVNVSLYDYWDAGQKVGPAYDARKIGVNSATTPRNGSAYNSYFNFNTGSGTANKYDWNRWPGGGQPPTLGIVASDLTENSDAGVPQFSNKVKTAKPNNCTTQDGSCPNDMGYLFPASGDSDYAKAYDNVQGLLDVS